MVSHESIELILTVAFIGLTIYFFYVSLISESILKRIVYQSIVIVNSVYLTITIPERFPNIMIK